ncbi:MAG TPA: hypothetical protein VN541_14550 [Tepidisphaeraceae bacterium]|nr:hypothetical protein [Tepidisphaeraceae bacterium]
MLMVHTTSLYDPGEMETRRRMYVARQTWERAYREFPNIVSGHQVISRAARTSASIGDDRRLPFVKDLVEFAFGLKTNAPVDAAIMTNTDTCMIPSRIPAAFDSLQSRGCYYSFRYEHGGFIRPLDDAAVGSAPIYSGADLFAFTRAWWERHRDDYPDLLLGAEAWDGVLKVMMNDSGFEPGSPIVYHEAHAAHWSQHLLTSPSQLHNRKLAAEWIERKRIPSFLCPAS